MLSRRFHPVLSRMPSKYLIFFACLIVAGCETPIRDPDVLPFKKNAIVSYGKNGMSIHDALEPLCDAKIRNTTHYQKHNP